ncbi:MAG: hypothetical protein EOP51_28015, partial [Sphingobacteriales bacterium]
GNGIEAFGYGVINIYGNTLDSCGYDGNTNPNGTQGQHSLYASDYTNSVEVNPKQTINVYGNAINHPKSAGALFVTGYFNNSLPASAYNNTFCIPNAPSNWLDAYVKLGVPGSTMYNNTLLCSGVINTPPTANAGADAIITLPASTVTLTGSGSDVNGTIAGYQWTKIAGPAAAIATPASASTTVNGLVEGVYKFELKVTDNEGAVGRDTVQVTVNALAITLLPAVNPANTVNGLDYKYYEGSWSVVPNFTALTPVKTGTVTNFDLSVANSSDNFGFSFTGYINVPADGVYTFYTTSDDGSNLYIDNVLTVANDGLHAAIEKSGTIGLKAGKHAISTGFFEQGGGEVLTVSYSGPGITKQLIPGSVLFRIPPANVNPTVSISSPSNGASFVAPATITINATATDSDGSISKVEFYNGTQKIGEDLTTPYTFVWSNVVSGSYSITAVATDNSSGTGTSAVVTVQVVNANPTVSITSPTNGTTFAASAIVTINATAADADGTISKVEFFNGTQKLGEDLTSPYSITFNTLSYPKNAAVLQSSFPVLFFSMNTYKLQIGSSHSKCFMRHKRYNIG